MKNRTKKIKKILMNNGRDFYEARKEKIMLKSKDAERAEKNRQSMIDHSAKVIAGVKEQEKDIQENKVRRWTKNIKKFDGKPVRDPKARNDDGLLGKTVKFEVK